MYSDIFIFILGQTTFLSLSFFLLFCLSLYLYFLSSLLPYSPFLCFFSSGLFFPSFFTSLPSLRVPQDLSDSRQKTHPGRPQGILFGSYTTTEKLTHNYNVRILAGVKILRLGSICVKIQKIERQTVVFLTVSITTQYTTIKEDLNTVKGPLYLQCL